MRNILARANRDVLAQFTWSNVMLAFDFDGTLAPIVADPARAAMRAATQRLLLGLAARYRVSVISGRAAADVRDRLPGTTGTIGMSGTSVGVVGNHGIEPWHRTRRFVNEVRRWLPALEQRLAAFKGVHIEDKEFSLAIHYRRSRAKKAALAAILAAIAELGPVRVIGGKMVVNLLPHGAPHKGLALEHERARLGCDTAIYVGDDETDEDVFTLDQPGRLLGIRVGARRASAAPYYLPDQRSVDELMRRLLALRSAPAARGAA